MTAPFLEPAEVDELQALWDRVAPSELHGIYSNVHGGDHATNYLVDQTIRRVFQRAASGLFAGATLRGASFLVKGTGVDSASTPHQDWNNVEEGIAQSLSVWCPLVDVDATNGELVVIPGSHLVRPSIRSIDIDSLYLDFTPEVEPHLRPVPVPAGHAVLYAHNLFHGSRANRTDRIRVAAVSGVLPDGARHVHYRRLRDDAGSIEALAIDERFYFEDIPTMKSGVLPPSASSLGVIPAPVPLLAWSDVRAAIATHAARAGGSMR